MQAGFRFFGEAISYLVQTPANVLVSYGLPLTVEKRGQRKIDAFETVELAGRLPQPFCKLTQITFCKLAWSNFRPA
jgi:hypothetical protein